MANISQVRYLILSNEIVIFCEALHICQLILYLEKKIIQLKGNTPPISVLSPPPTTLTLFNSFLFQEILQYFVLYSWMEGIIEQLPIYPNPTDTPILCF